MAATMAREARPERLAQWRSGVKKSVRRTWAMLLGGVVGIMLVLWMLMRGTPDWYHPRSMTVEQFEAAAQRATNKLAMVQNEAARARAVENAQRRHPSTSTSKPARDPITVSFTDDELNAFFDKWSVFQGLKNSYEKYLSDPGVRNVRRKAVPRIHG